jgi:hypothetical protein
VLTDNDLSRVIRPRVAEAGVHMPPMAFRQARELGLTTHDIVRAICHPSSRVLPDQVPDFVNGRAGVVSCPQLGDGRQVLLWLRDDPADPPVWIEVTGVG